MFEKKAASLLTADEIAELEFNLAAAPLAHPVVANTNGIRKARFGKQGSGKRGGVRVIYFYAISAEVVVLFTLYAKNEKDNLTNDDKKEIRALVEAITKTL